MILVCGRILLSKKISVRVSQEDYNYLKSRPISMSQWIRTAIRQLKSIRKYAKKHTKEKYLADPEFRVRIQLKSSIRQQKRKLRQRGNVNVF